MRLAARPCPPRLPLLVLQPRRRRLHGTLAFPSAAAADGANSTQVFVSRSHDALLNLSVEHHLLRSTPPGATVLLLYANSPAVVIGRNQNPWLEADLAGLARRGGSGHPTRLVRRRSGGGAVFHDVGNVNFGVICPAAAFDRDRYAHLVVRALAALGRPEARVNARHDIVVIDGAAGAGEFKVSGSAYKLTRQCALHHGTCLLQSPNVAAIGALLRSPAAPFVRARGVESVRTPVRNLGLDTADFEAAVVDEFRRLHGGRVDLHASFDAGALAVDAVRAGYDELRDAAWTYGQTPRFSFSTHPFADDARPRPPLPFDIKLRFSARHGVVDEFDVQGAGHRVDASGLVGQSLYLVRDWCARLSQAGFGDADATKVGAWLNQTLGTEFTGA